jgi:hypothetical protein
MRTMNRARTLLGAAGGVLSFGREVAAHLTWWLRYQVDGVAREEAPAREPGRDT